MQDSGSDIRFLEEADQAWLDGLLLEHLTKVTGRTDRQEEDICLSLELDGQLAGGLVARRLFDSCYLELLAVDPAFRHRRAGTLLLQALEKRCQTQGIRTIFLSTQDYQAPEFYRKAGYTLAGSLPDVPFEGTVRSYWYKRIPKSGQ